MKRAFGATDSRARYRKKGSRERRSFSPSTLSNGGFVVTVGGE
jgi:hypothetical protein